MRKRVRMSIGLLSGTSVDAAEAALCRIESSGATARVELVAHLSIPLGRALAKRLLSVSTLPELSELNFVLGETFAQAALRVIAKAKLRPSDVDVIGSHGQTVVHLPPSESRVPSTLQIGEASVIAERTGIPVVSDFRTRDVAAGGEGAPLVPYADWVMFRKRGVVRALQNIGGIANVSVVGDVLEHTLAFDTGPGNMLLDAFAQRATHGRLQMDRDGELSRRGKPIAPLLDELLGLPFFRRPPPKSAGREQFGSALAGRLWARYRHRPFDLLATAAAFTVESTARAYERYVLPRYSLEGIYVSGGGSRNPTLMRGLATRLHPIPVHRLDALGFPEEAKEAAAFALLASEWLSQRAQNIPHATGAKHPVLLGKMVL